MTIFIVPRKNSPPSPTRAPHLSMHSLTGTGSPECRTISVPYGFRVVLKFLSPPTGRHVAPRDPWVKIRDPYIFGLQPYRTVILRTRYTERLLLWMTIYFNRLKLMYDYPSAIFHPSEPSNNQTIWNLKTAIKIIKMTCSPSNIRRNNLKEILKYSIHTLTYCRSY